MRRHAYAMPICKALHMMRARALAFAFINIINFDAPALSRCTVLFTPPFLARSLARSLRGPGFHLLAQMCTATGHEASRAAFDTAGVCTVRAVAAH